MWIKINYSKKKYYLSWLFNNKKKETLVDSLVMDYFRGEYLGGWT